MTFYEALIKAIEKVKTEFDNPDILDSILGNNFIKNIKSYVSFLDTIPDNKIEDEAYKFLLIIMDYPYKKNYIHNERIDSTTTPNVRIKSDIKILEKTKFFLLNYLNNNEKEHLLFLDDIRAENETMFYHYNPIEYLNEIIHDLKTKKFHKIKKEMYYQTKANKTKLKEHLKLLVKHYSIIPSSIERKDLIDNLDTILSLQ